MKNSDMRITLNAMRKAAEKKYPQKDTPIEQYKAYGKIGLLTYCQARGYTYGEYADLLKVVSKRERIQTGKGPERARGIPA